MAKLLDSPKAPGGPGIEPRWTHSAKDVIGTAYSTSSRIWFTVSRGVLSEIYFPTIDRPQIRDLQFLVSDSETFFHDAHRHLSTSIEYLGEHGLGVRMTNNDPEGRYKLTAEVIADPHLPCLLIDTWLEGDPDFLKRLHVYVLVAPHLEVGGWHNNAYVADMEGREFLVAHKNDVWLAMAATTTFLKRSCGYVGTTDGWQDLAANFKMDDQFACAEDGNVAMMAEIDLREDNHFTLGLAFGRTLHRAVTTLFQSIGLPFIDHRERFLDQWSRACRHLYPLEHLTGDGGNLYRRSRELVMAHEDKSYPGALIASLSIPWGEVRSDDDVGGYHLVWTRDMINSATGLLAVGDTVTPLRALIYLACTQREDGGFAQNFWVNGEPYWQGIQLDEVAFPIMLAWRLAKAGALADFDPYPMVRGAARYIITHGPATPQERWEENSGYSPSTLASNIAALICAAAFAHQRGDESASRYLTDYADFLESHIEAWTVTTQGTLVPGIPRHYVRINPEDCSKPIPDEELEHKLMPIRNCPPGARWEYPANTIVDGGFLELVRHGIRRPGDAIIEDSVHVIDRVLKTDFPAGPCWKRYNHDGYGQRDDGGPFVSWGTGRPWPLLIGERGHYELAVGRDAQSYLRAMENFATPTKLLPEQVWDAPDIPHMRLYFGKPTGAAMPLMWAHAEYIRLLRSINDGQIFDQIPEVSDRYFNGRGRSDLEIWKRNRQIDVAKVGACVRIQGLRPFFLHWTLDEWHTVNDTRSELIAGSLDFVDVRIPQDARAPLRFTFRYPDGSWEGKDHIIKVVAK
jgi:glucoamylase